MKTPKPPTHFSPKAHELWRRVHAQYELEPECAELLRVAIEHMDLGDTARDLLRGEGAVLTDAKGVSHKHPALDAVKLHDGMMMRALKQLGLDVVAPGEPAGRRV